MKNISPNRLFYRALELYFGLDVMGMNDQNLCPQCHAEPYKAFGECSFLAYHSGACIIEHREHGEWIMHRGYMDFAPLGLEGKGFRGIRKALRHQLGVQKARARYES